MKPLLHASVIFFLKSFYKWDVLFILVCCAIVNTVPASYCQLRISLCCKCCMVLVEDSCATNFGNAYLIGNIVAGDATNLVPLTSRSSSLSAFTIFDARFLNRHHFPTTSIFRALIE